MDFGMLITSTALASVLVKFIDVWSKKREHKRSRADAKEDREAKKIEDSVTSNAKKLDALTEAVKLLTYDKFEFLAGKYISAGTITLKQLRVVSAMYDSYKALGGDGWADDLMELVKGLEVEQ